MTVDDDTAAPVLLSSDGGRRLDDFADQFHYRRGLHEPGQPVTLLVRLHPLMHHALPKVVRRLGRLVGVADVRWVRDAR